MTTLPTPTTSRSGWSAWTGWTPPLVARVSLKTHGFGHNQRDGGNDGWKPTFNGRERGGFLNSDICHQPHHLSIGWSRTRNGGLHRDQTFSERISRHPHGQHRHGTRSSQHLGRSILSRAIQHLHLVITACPQNPPCAFDTCTVLSLKPPQSRRAAFRDLADESSERAFLATKPLQCPTTRHHSTKSISKDH